MGNYKVIGIDLAKTKFHFVALNEAQEVVLKKGMKRDTFFEELPRLFPAPETFAFEPCGGCHYTAQKVQESGHRVILFKP